MKPYCNARRPILKGLAVAMLVLPVVAGCGDNGDGSTATLAPAAAADSAVDIGIDLDAFALAWGSGDADQIRTFYTDDAVIEPLGHLLDTLHADPQAEYWDVSGSDIDREAAQHAGARLEILDAVRVGDIIVDTARWTFPDGFASVPDGTVITGGDILHIRDGLIWRQFTDFQVFVNGEPVEI
jgi:hypothetical protein